MLLRTGQILIVALYSVSKPPVLVAEQSSLSRAQCGASIHQVRPAAAPGPDLCKRTLHKP